MLDKVYQPMAVQLARKGASRGMIVHRLCQEGINRQTAADIADDACSILAARVRLKGLCQAIAGLVVVGCAVLAYTAIRHPRIPIVVGMFGVITFGVGLANLSHRATAAGPATDVPPVPR